MVRRIKEKISKKRFNTKKENPMIITSFRPFTKKWMYYDEAIIHQTEKI
ncbi:type ISP restriction/modification enzyme [Staphylococcus aureus]|nr:type ISP restriction/modification enzyme [Staphylococcus aureus]